MLVRSAGDRATSQLPDPCPSLRRSLSYLPPFPAHPPLPSLSLHSARSPSFSLLPPPPGYTSDAAATITRARTRHHLQPRFGVIYVRIYDEDEARCTKDHLRVRARVRGCALDARFMQKCTLPGYV